MSTEQIISPIDIATGGYLSVTDSSYYAEPAIAIATAGYIIIVVTQVITPGGGGGKRKRYRHDDPLLAQALREDEEIIEIIIALTMSNLL